MSWKFLLSFITAIVIVCDGKDLKSEAITLRLISAHDEADNKLDTFTVTFESTVDVSAHTDIKLELIDHQNTPPFEKELESTSITQESGENLYTVTFPYMKEEMIDHNVNELLERSFKILMVIKNTGGVTQATGLKEVDLTAITEFPSSSNGQYVIDTTSTKTDAGWVRIATSGLIIMGGSILNPPCLIAPCYNYQDTLDTSITFKQCVDVTNNMYLCSDGDSNLVKIEAEDDTIAEQIIMDHADKLQVNLATDKKGATKMDLVIHKSSESDQLISCGGEDISSSNEVSCPGISIDPDQEEYKTLLVGYDDADAIKWTAVYTTKNHDLKTEFLTPEILEVNWDHETTGDLQYYHVTRTEVQPTDTYHEANVDCSAVGDPCFSYFIDIKNDGNYCATLQDCDANGCTDEIEIMTIKSEEKPRTSTKKVIDISDKHIGIKMFDSETVLDVCFEPIKNTSMINLQYELLVINSIGQWKRITKVQLGRNSYSCFHSVVLPDTYAKENSKAFVLLRNTKDRSIIASGHVKLPVQDVSKSSPGHTGDNMSSNSDNTVWVIVGASVGFLSCLVALVALIYTKFIRKVGSDDGIEHPLHSTVIEDSNISHGFDNHIATK